MNVYNPGALSPLSFIILFLALFLFFWALILVLMGLMSRKLKGRTVRKFLSTENIWPKVDAWAAQTGYRLIEQDQVSRLYQLGASLGFAPQRVKLTAMPGVYTLEAWVGLTPLNKKMSFGLVPDEMIVDQGGFFGFVPRRKAREGANELLQTLGVPIIE
jgi:hypothetical protein